MRQLTGPFALATCSIALLGIPAQAAVVVLDQSHQVTSADFDAAVVTTQSVAQVFTVGVAGTLERVGLQLYQLAGTPVGDLTLTIRSTTAGAPAASSSSALFSTVIPLASVPSFANPFPDPLGFLMVDLASAGIGVVSGQQLAITLSRIGPGAPPWVLWRGASNNPYAGGAGFRQSQNGSAWSSLDFSTDVGFQTFVRTGAVPVPVPSPAWLLLAALPGLLLSRRRRT
jgi:hypothetical protein